MRLITAVLAVIVSLVVGLLLILPTFLGTWAPIAHVTCAQADGVSTGPFYLPLGIVDSPYGGRGSVNATFDPQAVGYPPGWGINGLGSQMWNGSVAGSFQLETAVVYSVHNQTVLGAGRNGPCSSAEEVGLHADPYGGGGVGGQIFNLPWGPEFGTGAVSDSGEPIEFNFTNSSGNTTSIFHQGFTSANAPPVSTCDASSATRTVLSDELQTWIPFNRSGQEAEALTDLTLSQSFSYFFPANFGTWQIDNLSAPGGPGGGWAFSYSPCP